MNAVVSLCHFCELHGPSVLLSTQPSRSPNRFDSRRSDNEHRPDEGSQNSAFTNASSCEACQSLSNNTYVSSDLDTQTNFVTSQFPLQPETEGLVRQACTRSLSCEVSPGKEGVLVFSDDLGSGNAGGCSVLSHTFLLRDSVARGFHRWFSVTVLTRDRLLLLNMWPFLEKHISIFVSELQKAANKVYEAEQTSRPQRAFRLSNAYCADKSSRSLPELTGISQVFEQLHLWFVWLLRGAAIRLRETLPIVETSFPMEIFKEENNGFTFISPVKDLHLNQESLDNQSVSNCVLKTSGPHISSLAMLRSILGPLNFASVVFCLLVGRQVIVRGQPPVLVASILFTLKALLPRGCARLVPFSSQYLSPVECNMLGLEARAAVPQPSPQVARLEILPPLDCESPDSLNLLTDADQFSYHLKWPGQLPAKWPSYLLKVDRAMQSSLLSETTLMLQLNALRMETLNAARVLQQLETQDRKDFCDPRDKAALLQALGISPADTELVSFWSKYCLCS